MFQIKTEIFFILQVIVCFSAYTNDKTYCSKNHFCHYIQQKVCSVTIKFIFSFLFHCNVLLKFFFKSKLSTADQIANLVLDVLDEMLAELNFNENYVVVKINLTSVDKAIETLGSFNGIKGIAGGDIANLDVSACKDKTRSIFKAIKSTKVRMLMTLLITLLLLLTRLLTSFLTYLMKCLLN